MIPRIVRGLCLASFLIVFTSGPGLFGQSSSGGSITGAVSDPSGAAIPNAAVTLTGAATGVTLTTTSTSAGQFVFPVVPVGRYTLSVSARGFSQYRHTRNHGRSKPDDDGGGRAEGGDHHFNRRSDRLRSALGHDHSASFHGFRPEYLL
ncbi:MAG: carboxypeptidase-like regulatory domain-containing protein [Terriglobia bacterium]